MKYEMDPYGGYSRTLSLHEYILSAYLPNFTADYFRSDPDVDVFLDAIIRSQPELLEPTLPFPLRTRDIRHALHLILLSVNDAENWGDPGFGTSTRLLDELEDEWLEDCRYHGRNCQRLFRALAELSHAAGSMPLGSILRNFFMGWVDEIADEEEVEDLAGWCHGMRVAFVGARDKDECLRTLFSLRPDLLAEMQGMGANWIPLQVGSYPLERRPRRRGRLRWDDERERRLRRLMEDQELLERVADQDMKKLLRLRSRDWSPVRRPRRRGFGYSTRARSRGIIRSRSSDLYDYYPKRRQLGDRDRGSGLRLTYRSNESLADDLRDTANRIDELRDS